MSAFNGRPFRLMELQFFMVFETRLRLPGVPMPTDSLDAALLCSSVTTDVMAFRICRYSCPGIGIRIFSKRRRTDQE